MSEKYIKTKTAGVLLALLLVLTMLFSLCSCGSNDEKQKEEEKTVTESSESEDTKDEEVDEESEEKDDEPVDLIDLDGLSAIESNDTSKVKITKKEIQKDAISGFSMRGGDAAIFTISNESDADVAEFTLYMVGYNEKNGLTVVQPSYSTYGTIPYIQSFSFQTAIKAGTSEKVTFEVDSDKFVGIKAIVASYKTSDGTTYENPITQDWVNSVQLDKKEVLD